MRTRLQAGLGITALIVSTLVLPRQGAAQSAPAASPWTAATSAAPVTDTNGKSKQSIELNSFQTGAANPANATNGTGTKEGKTAVSDINVSGPKTLTVYKGPDIVVPPSGGKPNDSAHHHPKH